MKKKIMILLLSACFILGGLNGCGGQAAGTKEENTEAGGQNEDTDGAEPGKEETAEADTGNEPANGQEASPDGALRQGEKEMFEGGSTKTAEELAAIEAAAAIEIEPLTLITEWQQKAVITLGDTVSIDGTGAEVKENIVVISQGGAYDISGTLTEGMIYVETDENVKLILNGVTVTNNSGPAIYVYDSASTYIELADGTENILTDGEEYTGVFSQNTDSSEQSVGKAALFSNDDLIFVGNGSLTVTGNYKHAISSDDMVYFEGGSFTLSAVKDGVHVNDGICIDGGKIEVLSAHDGLESEGAFVVNDGVITVAAEDDGLTTLGNMEVNGGTITITACEEGLEAKNHLVVNDGTIEVTGNDDGLNGGSLVEINGGLVYVNMTSGDGLDSSGELSVNGGITVALGAQQPEGGADCDQNAFTITGGVLIATGGTNSTPTEAYCTQVSMLIGAASEGDMVALKDKAGNTVFAFSVRKQYSNMLLSIPAVEEGQDYSVFTGGSISGSETFHGYYEKASYSGGSESVAFTADSMVVSAGGSADVMGGGGRGGMGPGAEAGEPPEGIQMPENGERPEELPEDGEWPEN